MGNIININADSFSKEVIESDIPVVVDFWAPWCMPCKMITPLLEEVAAENAERIKVVKVNTDEEADLANQYGISSIPTLLVFNKGLKVNQHVGALNKAALLKLVADL